MNCFGDHKIKWLFFAVFTVFLLHEVQSQVKPFSGVHTHKVEPRSYDLLEKYLIVFDAGSTGTRIHVYRFSSNEGGVLILKGEFYDRVMKSLSSFSKRPREAAKIITHFLKEAKEIIPKAKWNTTLVSLKATAGFRVLPNNTANSILNEVRKAIDNSSFSCAKECVSILSGENEGLYGWYSLNFLLDTIGKENDSVALLAVGGRSLQITFSLSKANSNSLKDDYKFLPKVQSEPIPIYSRSYLGLGTTSAKLSILKIPSNTSELVSSKTRKTPKSGIELSSPCVHPLEKITLKYKSEKYQIRGDRNGKSGYKHCYKKAVELLGNKINPPEELRNQKIYGVSNHFINVIASTLLMYKPSGSFIVGKFISSCKLICQLPLGTFGCLDCCYIAALLQHSLGFGSEKEIKFATDIRGISTSWTLGAALEML